MAVVEQQLHDLDREVFRTRERLHDLEGDRASLKILLQEVERLNRTLPQIAEDAAQRAVGLALEHREELKRGRFSVRTQFVGVGVAVGGFAAMLVFETLRVLG